MTLSLLLVALAAGPELEHCRLGGVAFTSQGGGWAFDYCGHIFATKDGGATWELDEGAPAFLREADPGLGTDLSLGAALADGSVVAGGYIGARMLRKTAAGWASVALPSDQWNYALSHAGEHVWVCGSSGEVVHGTAFGAKWVRAKKSPTDANDRCISLSFLDGRRGWVAGWSGSLYETLDGGGSWRAIRLPRELARAAERGHALEQILRVNDRLGFAAGPAGTWRTVDGGRNWRKLQRADVSTARAVALPDGSRVLVSAESAGREVEAWEPILEVELSPYGKGSVAISGPRILYYGEDGALTRVGRITGRGSGEKPDLASVRTLDLTTRYALGTRRAFFSEDSGASWFELGALPGDAPFDALVFANARTALARARGGELYVSDDAGASWSASRNPALDAHDLGRLLGASSPDPLRCLREATSGSVTIAFGAQGCFGGSRSSLRLEWTASGGALHASRVAKDEAGAPSVGRLGVEQTRALLARLAAEVLRPEVPSPCSSTTAYLADVDVTCELDGGRRHEVVRLSSHDCHPREALAAGVGGSTSVGGPPAGYARAIGVHDLAKEVADSLASK